MKVLFRFIFLFCLLSAQISFGQVFDLQCGPVMKYKGLYTEEKVIMTTPENFYTLRKRPSAFTKDRYTILKYNSRMEMLWERKLPITSGEYSDRILEEVLELNGKMIAFTSGKEKDLQCAWAQEISTEGKLIDEPLKVDEMPAETFSSAGGFFFRHSADTANILLFHREPQKAKELTQVSFILLDADLGAQWKKRFSYNHEEEARILDYTADANHLYVLSRRTIKEKSKDRDTEKLTYWLQHHNVELKEDHSYQLYAAADAKGKIITALRMASFVRGELLIAGLYAKKKETSPQGTFLFRLDAIVNKMVTEEYDEFSEKLYEELKGDRELVFLRPPAVYENISDLYRYIITDLLSDDEGNITLAVEKYCELTTMRSSAQVSPTNLVSETHFFHSDILLVQWDAPGDLLWTSRIPKAQHTLNDGGVYSSFRLIPLNGHFKLLYNDNPRNLDTGYSFSMMIPQDAYTVVINIDQEGNYSKKQLFQAKEMRTIFMPRLIINGEPGRIMLYWQFKNRFRYCDLRFRN